MSEWRAITVRNPWAWAVSVGAKTVENRTGGVGRWEWYDGLLMIHAGKGWSERGQHDPRVLQAWRDAYPSTVTPLVGVQGVPNLPVVMHPGEVVAVARIADVHPAEGWCGDQCCLPWGEHEYQEAGGRRRTDITHLVLDRIQAIQVPLRVRGSLGLWRPPEHLVHLVERLLEEVEQITDPGVDAGG